MSKKLASKSTAKKVSPSKPAKIRSRAFAAMAVPAPMSDPFALLADLQDQLSKLFDNVSDPADKQRILKTMMDVSSFSSKLFQNAIDTNTEEWAVADAELKTAIKAVKEAQQAIDKTIDTIKKVARAIEIAAKIAAVAA